MNRLSLWLAGILIYGLFWAWYTNLSGPLSDTEIREFMSLVADSGRTPEDIRNIEQFMRSDTGNDFIMINLLDMNETPPELPATGPGADASALLAHYMEHMYPAQLARASHPAFFGRAVADAMDISGVQGAAHWEQGALFRYRSRRDVMAIATDPRFAERHHYKLAALTKTIAYPVEPLLHPGDLRILLALAIFSLVSLIDLIVFRRRRA